MLPVPTFSDPARVKNTLLALTGAQTEFFAGRFGIMPRGGPGGMEASAMHALDLLDDKTATEIASCQSAITLARIHERHRSNAAVRAKAAHDVRRLEGELQAALGGDDESALVLARARLAEANAAKSAISGEAGMIDNLLTQARDAHQRESDEITARNQNEFFTQADAECDEAMQRIVEIFKRPDFVEAFGAFSHSQFLLSLRGSARQLGTTIRAALVASIRPMPDSRRIPTVGERDAVSDVPPRPVLMEPVGGLMSMK
jgi:hypothetical protein